MRIIICLLLTISLAEAKPQDPCEYPKSKFNIKNLRDLDYLTQFMRFTEFYPWFQYHCNGVICTPEEFENMCYLVKQALKKKQDPNLINVGKLN